MTFRFDIADLRLFCHVVDAGSLTAGAEAAGLGLAAASARVLALEDSLGGPLLTRHARGVLPTPAGELLLLHARGLLHGLSVLHADIAAQSPALHHVVRLACTPLALQGAVPDRLCRLLAAWPQLDVAVIERGDAEAVAAVANRQVDIALVACGTDLLGLPGVPLPPERWVLVTPTDHPLALAAAASGRPVALAQADGCDIVALAAGDLLQDAWDRRAALRGVRLNHRIRVGSVDALCRLVAAGAGVAVLPASAARGPAASLALAMLVLADDIAEQALVACVHHRERLGATAGRVLEALQTTPQAGTALAA